VVLGDIAGDAGGDTGAAAALDGAVEPAPADCVVAPVAPAGADAAAETATFAWVTLPLSPGLPMRMLTLTLAGATCVTAGTAVDELVAGAV
jgi:hypothetical protein